MNIITIVMAKSIVNLAKHGLNIDKYDLIESPNESDDEYVYYTGGVDDSELVDIITTIYHCALYKKYIEIRFIHRGKHIII